MGPVPAYRICCFLALEAVVRAAPQASHTSDLRKSLQLGIRAIELAEAELAAEGASLQELASYDGVVSSSGAASTAALRTPAALPQNLIGTGCNI